MSCVKGTRCLTPESHGLLLVVLLVAILSSCSVSSNYHLRSKTSKTFTVSTILTPALARKRGSGPENSAYVGFIPEFLKALKERKAISNNYVIREAPGNEIGYKTAGHWTGLLGDVANLTENAVCLGAGPLLSKDVYKSHVKLSESWMMVKLVVVVSKTSNITNLNDARLVNILAVANSVELTELENATTKADNLKKLYTMITDNSNDGIVSNIENGLKRASREQNSGFLMNSVDALYHTTHDYCNLRILHDVDYKMGDYVFAITRGVTEIDYINIAIKNMMHDGSLDRLKNAELGSEGICSNAVICRPEKPLTFLVAAILAAIGKKILL